MAIDPRAITRELCQRSYYNFFKRAWHVVEPSRPFVDNWHIWYLCNVADYEINRIARNEIKEFDYIVNMPFRAGKSHIFSVFLQPWAWIKYPWLRFTTFSYSGGLSANHSNKSQKLMGSEWYQSHFGDCFNLKSDVGGSSKLKETEGYFENDHGGFRFVGSITGSATGYGGDVNIADDILKAQDVESEAQRRRANEFWSETYPSRVSDFDKSVFFLIMQRLHDNDPSGNSLQRQEGSDERKYFHINIPGEDIGNVKPKALKTYYQNGLFFPERFSRKVLDTLKSTAGIGKKSYDAQVNQTPHSVGGNLFQKSWFPRIDRRDMPRRKSFDSITRYWDTAYTEDEKNSACAFVELGLYKHLVYLLNFGYKWLEFPEQIKWMEQWDGVHKIEAKASGKSAAQTLQRKGLPAIEVPIEGADKRTRANSISFHCEAGLVCIPDYLFDEFMDDIRQGILKYPEGTHTDLGDAFVLGITDLLGIPKHLDRSNLDKVIEQQQEPAHIFHA